MIIAGLDVETTGVNEDDEVVEVGAVVMDTNGTIIYTYSEIFKTNRWSVEAEKIHGISRDISNIGRAHSDIDLFNNVMRFSPFVVVAHNANYDRSMIIKYWNDFDSVQWLCTKDDLPHNDLIKVSSLRLGHLASDYGIINNYQHRALFDAITACQIAIKHDLQSIVDDLSSSVERVSVTYFGKPDFSSDEFNKVKDFLKKNGFSWDKEKWYKNKVSGNVVDKLLKISKVSNWIVTVK
jgi:DNA polymerase III alpha subunit (gram-positive type)